MAKSGQQGAGVLTVWLIVFVFFWLVSTVWLVVLYTGQTELKATAERFRREADRLATSQEMNSIEVVKNIGDGGPTALGALEEARAETARLGTGDPKDSVAAVKTKRDAILGSIRTDGAVSKPEAFEDASLLQALSLLYERFKSEHELRMGAEARSVELDGEVARNVQLTADLKSDLEKRAQGISDQLTSVEADRSAYRTDRDAAVSSLEQTFDVRRAQTDADLTKERQRRAECERLAGEMQKRFAALEEQYGGIRIGPEPLSTARKPDGKVLTAVPSDDVVYINLGKGDRLIPGLKFAVYVGGERIPVDGRAKAQIEVVSISDSSSEARIVWVAPGEIILADDLIANPVYDRDRAPSFLVLGEFDLNRDGFPDAEGRSDIEAIVKEWGAAVTVEVTATTDFVVLGTAPPKPRELANATPEQKTRLERDQRIWDRYNDLLSGAHNLAIPIMTQEVFLNFLGNRPGRIVRR